MLISKLNQKENIIGCLFFFSSSLSRIIFFFTFQVIHEVRRTVDRESENFAQDAVEKFGKFIESAVYFATSKLKDFVCSIMLPGK